jgi:4-hydroxymandelate oxidase
MIVSTSSTTAIEEVAAVPGLRTWFQLYCLADRDATQALVERAVAAGVEAVVITVDVLPLRPLPTPFAFGFPPIEYPHHGPAPLPERHLDTAYLRRLIAACPRPVLVKGILHPDDARAAVDLGAAGVVVSNHGGRTADGVVASIDALPGVVEAIGDAAEVLMDGGIRTGMDVLRAMSRGARAVLLGRPVIWSLALAGSGGVSQVLARLEAEVARATATAGLTATRSVGSDAFRVADDGSTS